MSDPPQPFGPFGAFDLNQMLRFLQVEGPVHWEVAAQVARWVALEGAAEEAIDAETRTRLTEVYRAAEANALTATDSPPASAGVEILGKAEWADRALRSMRPVLERLAVTLQGPAGFGASAGLGHDAEDQPGGVNPLAGMLGALGPLLLGVQCGFMAGQLAQGLLSQHDLLLPVDDAPRPAFIVANVEAFHSAWSVPADDFRFYLALGEAVRSRVSARPWVRRRLVELACEYVGSFQVDPGALESQLESQLGSLDLSDPSSLEGLMRDPDAILGAMQSPRQLAVLERLQTTTAIFESYADAVVDRVAAPLLTSLSGIREAMRRHRVDRSQSDRFVQRLLGLDPNRKAHEVAASFCAGVLERDEAGLARLLEGEAFLPTPAELEAPGLWLARLEMTNPPSA